MNEREPFLIRWSRRKRDAADDAASVPPEGPASADPAVRDAVGDPARAQASNQSVADRAEAPAVDLSALPPLESITAETDIRAFLAPGIPAELTRAALRRAWSADPAIRDFIGLVENGWDFNAPDGIPGFGPLQLTDEVRRLVETMVGGSDGPSPAGNSVTAVTNMQQPPSPSAETGAGKPADSAGATIGIPASRDGEVKQILAARQDEAETSSGQIEAASQQNDTALQYSRDESHVRTGPIRRGHGRALPE